MTSTAEPAGPARARRVRRARALRRRRHVCRLLLWSARLGRWKETGIEAHWSFVLLIAMLVFSHWETAHVGASLWFVVLLGSMAIGLLAHEMGHAFAARRYGIAVPGIVFLPIGAAALLEKMPREPARELVIALAGPAASFAVALGCWGLREWLEALELVRPHGAIPRLLAVLIGFNGAIGIFNLVPIFPMDGGRVLRAVLATSMRYERATHVAVVTGRVLATAGIGYFFSPWSVLSYPIVNSLSLLFVLVLGEIEYRQVTAAVRQIEHADSLPQEDMARRSRNPMRVRDAA